MSEIELYEELAAKTGEPISTIRQHGFSLLGPNQIEERDEPLMVDWDEVEGA